MYTREEASRLRQEFWTTFGRYMNPVPSSEGKKANWINYHTGISDVFFRMDADAHEASIAIMLEHSEIVMQELYFEKFLQLKKVMQTELEEEWNWSKHELQNNRMISRIYKTLPDVSVYNKTHWPDLISFLKPRIIKLDRFWENARYRFDGLK
jgi:Domain of unknown function (DUF4268)